MAKVIKVKFPHKSDAEVIKLCHLADDIDAVIKHYLLDEQVDVRDLVGVVSHRLGTLLNKVETKDRVWQICEEVLRRQAKMDKSS